jgi:hypothetical protein
VAAFPEVPPQFQYDGGPPAAIHLLARNLSAKSLMALFSLRFTTPSCRGRFRRPRSLVLPL